MHWSIQMEMCSLQEAEQKIREGTQEYDGVGDG